MAPLRTPAMLAAVFSLLTCLQPSLVAAGPVARRSDVTVKDYHKAPRFWSNLGPAPSEHLIHLTVGLSQGRFDELERHLYEVSDPAHTRYGQHLSADEVNELVKPSDEASAAVHEWLEEYGIDIDHLTYSPAKDWVSIRLPVSVVEDMLNTEYSVWEHRDGSTIVRTEGYSLPNYVHKHISTIQPTNSFARLEGHKKRKEVMKRSVLNKRTSHALEAADAWGPPATIPLPDNSTIYAACNFTHVTPDCLRTLYGTIDYEVRAAGANRMGHTNYLDEATNRSDISQFLGLYRPEAQAYAYEFEAISIAGGVLDNGTNVAADGLDREANLDAEYMIGIAFPTPLTAYHTGGRDPTYIPDILTTDNSDEPFLVWAQYVAALQDDEIPQVISTSYGDDEQTVSRAYAQAVCNQFAQLGARGVSLFFSSGDFGVGQDETCISNIDNTTAMFIPSFPTDCPYVTTVGATTGYPESAAWRKLSSGLYFNSGAGFSNYFDQPSYQADSVNAYIAGLDGLYDGLYNKSGRAYPDIAAIGQLFPTIWNGTTLNLVGTSGSSPIAAAVFTLLNDALIAEGRPPVGFLNPWLYARGHILFTDVTNGSSAGCNTSGFPATEGWDAVTGWGTPYLPKLLEAFGLENSGKEYVEAAFTFSAWTFRKDRKRHAPRHLSAFQNDEKPDRVPTKADGCTDVDEAPAKTKTTGENGNTDDLLDALKSMSIATPRTEAKGSVQVLSKGRMVPASTIMEIKTRSAHRKLKVDEVIPQLWFAQTPNLFVGYHINGKFQEIQKLSMKDDFERWEKSQQARLKQLIGLLKRLKELVQKTKGHRCVVVCEMETNSAQLRVYESTKTGAVLPNDIINMHEWAEERGAKEVKEVEVAPGKDS